MSKVFPIFATAVAAADDDTSNPAKLTKENAELRKENAKLQTENAQLKRKVADLQKRKQQGGVGGGPPTKKARTASQVKKLFEKWTKSLKRLSSKSKITNPFGGESFKVSVKETIPWSKEDFTGLFENKGTKIQPTPENKPTSQITILKFANYEAVKALFGDTEIAEDGYTVQVFRARSFCKSYKNGDADALLKDLEIHYNKSKQTLELQFGMEMDDGGDY